MSEDKKLFEPRSGEPSNSDDTVNSFHSHTRCHDVPDSANLGGVPLNTKTRFTTYGRRADTDHTPTKPPTVAAETSQSRASPFFVDSPSPDLRGRVLRPHGAEKSDGHEVVVPHQVVVPFLGPGNSPRPRCNARHPFGRRRPFATRQSGPATAVGRRSCRWRR